MGLHDVLIKGWVIPVIIGFALCHPGSAVAGQRHLDAPEVGDIMLDGHGRAEQEAIRTQFDFPQGLSIQALTAVGSDRVYAGSFGKGVFRSEDRGQTWKPVNQGLTDPFILSLAAAPDGTLYAGTVRGGVFRSPDGGKTWKSINEGLKRLQIKHILVVGSGTYAGTGNGVYRYNKTKARWSPVKPGLDDVLVHCVASAADGTLYAGTSGKGVQVYRTKRRGWQRVSAGLVDHEGLGENFIRVLTVDHDQAVYVGTFDGGVFRSVDGGQHWKPISRALPNDSIRGIVANTTGLIVATGRGIFRTSDHGGTWIPVNEGLTELAIQTLILADGGALYAGTSGGAFRSDDGRSWIAINEGMEGTGGPPFEFRR